MTRVRISFSPCPNDTFIFDAMIHQKIDTEGITFEYRMADVEQLNRLAFLKQPEMTKVSYHAWLYLRSQYHLINSGSALGYGNGPLIISKSPFLMDELESRTIGIPGKFTTAHLLLKMAAPKVINKKILIFNEIEDAILRGNIDAGVIIHENRFTYEKKGLIKILDLGEYWENLTHAPIPLGGIVVRKDLGPVLTGKLERVMQRSVLFAMKYPDSSMDFVRKNAQEMEDEVLKKHIELYVNDFTVDLGMTGRIAIQKLEEYSIGFMANG